MSEVERSVSWRRLKAVCLVMSALLAVGGTGRVAAAEVTPAQPATTRPTETGSGTGASTDPPSETTPTQEPDGSSADAVSAAGQITLSVDPATNLRPGQVVTATVTGVGTNSYTYLIECPVERVGTIGCQYMATPSIQNDGTAVANVSVARHLEQNLAVVDCAVSACEIVAFVDAVTAAAPLSFDPAATPETLPLEVGPPGPYGDGQVVLVWGAGFEPDTTVRLVECLSTAGVECMVPGTPAAGVDLGSGVTQDDGKLLVGTRLSRAVSGADCADAPHTCEVRLSLYGGLDQAAATGLTFDANIVPLPHPSVSITPSANLLDGEAVAVAASNFLPNNAVYVSECLGSVSCRYLGEGMTNARGTVGLSVTLKRLVAGSDCTVEGCRLTVQSSAGADIVNVPLDFDASVPPPPQPSLTVSPSTGLVDLQTVDVQADGLGDSYVSLEQCDSGGAACRELASGEATAGKFSATVGVRRVILGSEGGYDCATEEAGCVIRMSAYGDDYVTAEQPLQFDPDGPLPKPPAASLVPNRGLDDGDLVRLVGSGFDPSDSLSVAECPGDPPEPFNAYAPGDCTVLRSYSVHPTADGSIDQRIGVHRNLTLADGTTRDCAQPGCTLIVHSDFARVVLSLRFDRKGQDETSAFPAQLACVPWPTTTWPTGPLPAGVDPAVMDSIANSALKQDSSVESIVVIHGGRLVFERYRDGLGPDSEFHSFSMAKSMTSSIIGMLIEEGRLELDGPAPVPEWSDPADPRHEISVRNLLNMSSGLLWTESYYDASSDVIQMLAGAGSADMAHYAASRPLQYPPGTAWQYSTGDSMILAGIIAREVGTGATLDAFLHQRLFDPIGMNPITLGHDGSGAWIGGAVADTTTRNFARFGLLYLRGGTWDGTKVLADGWAQYARTPAPTSSGYGAQFWLDGGYPGAFEAIGFLGQEIEIVPELDLVIAINSANGNTVDVGGIINQFAGAAPPGCGTVTANDDSTTVRAGRGAAIRVLGNDLSTGGALDRKTLKLVRTPSVGSARIFGRTILYRAPRGTSGQTDALTYEVCNRQGDCDDAKVTVQIR